MYVVADTKDGSKLERRQKTEEGGGKKNMKENAEESGLPGPKNKKARFSYLQIQKGQIFKNEKEAK